MVFRFYQLINDPFVWHMGVTPFHARLSLRLPIPPFYGTSTMKRRRLSCGPEKNFLFFQGFPSFANASRSIRSSYTTFTFISIPSSLLVFYTKSSHAVPVHSPPLAFINKWLFQGKHSGFCRTRLRSNDYMPWIHR